MTFGYLAMLAFVFWTALRISCRLRDRITEEDDDFVCYTTLMLDVVYAAAATWFVHCIL